jgi:hypothetical protein
MASGGRRPRGRSRRWIVFGGVVTLLILTVNAALSAQSGAPARRFGTQNFLDVAESDVQRSIQEGADVTEVRADALTLGRDGITRRLDRVASDADAILRDVRRVTAPTNLRDARDLLLAALTIRAQSSATLRKAFADALGNSPATSVVDAMVEVGKNLAAADRVYRLFVAALPAGLVTMPDSQWVRDDGSWTQPIVATFVASLRSSASLAPVHDVKVVLVSPDPGPVALDAGNEVLPISKILKVQIVVANVGNEPEKRLTVTASISPAVDGPGSSARDFVDLVPGQRMTLTLGDLRAVPNAVTILQVHIDPAPGQLNMPDTTQTLDFVMH